jgi:hypothetical protein
MTKVKVQYKSGKTLELDVTPDKVKFYDDLPFNNPDVISTEIQESPDA